MAAYLELNLGSGRSRGKGEVEGKVGGEGNWYSATYIRNSKCPLLHAGDIAPNVHHGRPVEGGSPCEGM